MRRLLVMVCMMACASALPAAEPLEFEAGFARVDITPKAPLRLSGYAARTEPFDHVQTPIDTRAMAFRAPGDSICLLITIDTIGPPVALTDPVAKRIEKTYGVTRDRVVFCGSHCHSTPHLAGGLVNLFSKPLPPDQKAATKKYTQRLADAIVKVAGQAIQDMAPATFSYGQGKVGFAMNRRVPNVPNSAPPATPPRGQVDRSVPILKIASPQGTLRGVIFNYACHATTLTGASNVVNGDWPGYACRYLEEKYPKSVALCTIGCGGDANPAPRAGEHPARLAQAHGREMALEVIRLIEQELAPVTEAPQASFGYAALPVDRPTAADLEADLKSSLPQVVRRAQFYLDVIKRKGRIPETYPMPIQTWQFGDELTMIFLGGEVVVDYALRLKKELDNDLVWVSAYSNDVFAYVASEEMLSEGGYEVDSSMIYYNRPGRWMSGTEDLIIERVHEVLANPEGEHALSPAEAKHSLIVPEGFTVDLVAREPLIEDPVNIAFAPDGRLWVVEMRDYPRGEDGHGEPGGRIKVLTDTDNDGVFDEATVFLKGLSYPNGVIPWREGAIVSCAPDIVFAKDTDGDGQADMRRVLFTGFPEANPQHRVNGFTWGLDGLMYVAHGANHITCPVTGKTYNLAGRDFAFDPDTCELVTKSGGSQFGRARDSWGSWFANSNSVPLFHYIAEDNLLSRNPYVSLPNPLRRIVPAELYRLWPQARIVGRFNDLATAGRFTGACSPVIFRAPGFGEHPVAFVCASVHNLVRGFELVPHGVSFEAKLLSVNGKETVNDEEMPREFFAATDPWCRPVRAKTGPDGTLWIVDMYRLVIEHPQWIPDAWLARINVRAGSGKGRIWRVRRTSQEPKPLPDLTKLATSELVAQLDDPNGVVRDLAQQLLIWRDDRSAIPLIRDLVRTAQRPTGVVQSLAALGTLDALDENTLLVGLGHEDPRVVRFAMRMAAPLLDEHPRLGKRIVELSKQEDARVRLQAAFALGRWDESRAAEALAALAAGPDPSGWIRVAVKSSACGKAEQILAELLRRDQTTIVPALVATILGEHPTQGPGQVLEILQAESNEPSLWRLTAVTAVANRTPEEQREAIAGHPVVHSALAFARERLHDDSAAAKVRVLAAGLLAGPLAAREDHQQLVDSLSPRLPIEIQEEIVAALGRAGDPAIAPLLLAEWNHHAPRIRRVILQALLSRPSWTPALLEAMDAETVKAADLDAAARQQLLSSGKETIRRRAEKLLNAKETTSRAAVVARYKSVSEITGEVARGRQVFQDSCASCHRLEGIGHDFGANLATLTNRSTSALLVAILDPNQAVEARYHGYTIVTTDGRVLTGLITSETSTAITLASADGRTKQILRTDIAVLRDTGQSFMPEGLEKELSQQELADVIAFVQQAG